MAVLKSMAIPAMAAFWQNDLVSSTSASSSRSYSSSLLQLFRNSSLTPPQRRHHTVYLNTHNPSTMPDEYHHTLKNHGSGSKKTDKVFYVLHEVQQVVSH